MKRYNNKNSNNFSLWILSVILILLCIIIGLSLYQQQPVDKATSIMWSRIKGDSIVVLPSSESLVIDIDRKSFLIDSLKLQLKKYEETKIHKKALVSVESGTLNMRDKPLLASSIVVRIPDSSFVDVLYFDTEYFYLNGKRGRWCKIKYADTVGWVWDDFIKIQK